MRLGISDGVSTELLVGPNSPDAAALKEGAAVVTGVTNSPGAAAGGQRNAAPGPRPVF